MAVSSDYSTPVTVNDFTCRNCTDVSYAKRHIDPEHPKSGPFGVNAASDPSRQLEAAFWLDGLALERGAGAVVVEPAAKALGASLDIRV